MGVEPERGVYIVGELGRIDPRVKIGMTLTSKRGRLEALQRQAPGPLELLWWQPCSTATETRKLEGMLHEYWEPLRVHGEWFRYEGTLFEFVGNPHRGLPDET